MDQDNSKDRDIRLINVEFAGVSGVKAVYSTRTGGFSKRPYDSMNIAEHVNDAEELVLKNRNLLRSNFTGNPVISWMNQTHSTDVAFIDNLQDVEDITDADAQITTLPGVALAVMTADCLPLLLTVDDGSMVACIHGGWRGLSGGIIANTVAAMDVPTKKIHVWLGPCIGPEKFEVGDMVRSEFVGQDTEYSLFFKKINYKENKYLADLQAIATFQLKELGINKITSDTSCTFSEPDRFFSYRRDGITGRTAGFIWR